MLVNDCRVVRGTSCERLWRRGGCESSEGCRRWWRGGGEEEFEIGEGLRGDERWGVELG